MSYFIGTDIGGTFTDLVMLSETGQVTIVKSPTTPSDRTRGVLAALDAAASRLGIKREALIADLQYFAHGTTAATNAFIERKGVKTGLLTTEGFADTLRVQRCMASWAGLSDHEIAHFSTRSIPVPIIPLELIEDVEERVDYKGKVIETLNEARARDSIRRLVGQGVEAIAVMLLWSFRNPAHEQRLEALVHEEAPGVFASQKLGEQIGYKNIITSDMGGTSFDVGLIVDGQPILETSREVGRFHVALPSIKVTAIGSGGGSIARIAAGHLTVGPDSAGSEPGPACYGRGGTEPTITDADVVLGIIDPDYFLGGEMEIDVALAKRAIEDKIARPLGLDVYAAAAGIREVANNQMADLLRRVTTRSGYDPRDFVIFAYGGAGPTHAHHYGAVAGIATVVVPTTASAHSALGAVTADRHRSFSRAFGQHAPPHFNRASDHVDAGALNRGFQALAERCRDALGKDCNIERLVAMRFRLQVHEIPVEVPNRTLEPADIDLLVDRFEERYERIYGKGTALKSSGVEFNVLRTEAISPVMKPTLAPLAKRDGVAKPLGMRQVYFYRQGFKETPVYRFEELGPGTRIDGPLIVERPDTTVVVGVGQSLEIEPYGNIILHLAAQGGH